jgi:hypothetical protein
VLDQPTVHRGRRLRRPDRPGHPERCRRLLGRAPRPRVQPHRSCRTPGKPAGRRVPFHRPANGIPAFATGFPRHEHEQSRGAAEHGRPGKRTMVDPW